MALSINFKLWNILIPEYASMSKPDVKTVAGVAALSIKESLWGTDKGNLALIYATAHMIKMGERNGSGGQVTSEKVGDLARTFSANSGSEEYWDSTSYGQEFLRIRKQIVTSPFIADC